MRRMCDMKNIKIDATMKQCAELLVMKDINGLDNDDIAEQCGINRSTLYRWKQRPDFIEYMNTLAEDFQKSFLADAYAELRKIMLYSKNPNAKLKALEMFMKNQGRLKDVQETTTKVQAELSVEEMLKELGV